MNDWHIVLLHTRAETMLKQVFEMAFPGRVVPIHVPAVSRLDWGISPQDVMHYFQQHVWDPGVWRNRVLTIYGDGDFHHFTYALVWGAIRRRGLGGNRIFSPDFTYFHIDNHRDDWTHVPTGKLPERLNCGNFVDTLAYDNHCTPFFVGPDVYAKKDSRGYRVDRGWRGPLEIPIYHNGFSKNLQESQRWTNNQAMLGKNSPVRLPARRDLEETPREAYLSFDLDVLPATEIVTNFDQNPRMTLRTLLHIVDRIREHKRVFSADILGFPDTCTHPLSAFTMVVLARKIMGLGVERLLDYHTMYKQRQGQMFKRGSGIWRRLYTSSYQNYKDRTSPVEMEELLEVLRVYA